MASGFKNPYTVQKLNNFILKYIVLLLKSNIYVEKVYFRKNYTVQILNLDLEESELKAVIVEKFNEMTILKTKIDLILHFNN